ncbi:MAG TPA: D-alanyl-D-alanine carboxypeptidase/D-alanyl-D-alanine-endopeptidase [Mycobacteriales bacterium]|nr:D-alanyl-D-alanine carboxypeptidase/D-alanyl-D-alanine-endopeptidase [Mycobacteriales bacterium]
MGLIGLRLARPALARSRGSTWVPFAVAAAVVAGGVAVELRRTGAPRLGAVASSPAPTLTATHGGSAAAVPTPSPLPRLGQALDAAAGVLTQGAVAAAVNPTLADSRLGPRVSAVVVDGPTGTVLYSRNASLAVLPASTAKVMTAVAALHVLGPERQLETTVVPVGTLVSGRLDGRLLLVGAGDATLASPAGAKRSRYPRPARLEVLADAVRTAGITSITGAVAVDSGAFGPPRSGPAWKPTYFTEGSVAPVTALMVDGGRITPGKSDRHSEPDLAAGRALRDLLRQRGITVPDLVVRATAPVGVAPIGRVSSPPVAALVERMLAASDNNLAESLGHLVARERGLPATFAGAAQGVAAALSELGAPGDGSGLVDGSGLSPRNRVTTAGLARVLALGLSAEQPRLRALISGLPVGGFDGTLSERYDEAPAAAGAGRVRAKTGSLDNVSTLAGFVETADGRQLVFAFSADRLPSRAATTGAEVLDAAAAALASCGCSQ